MEGSNDEQAWEKVMNLLRLNRDNRGQFKDKQVVLFTGDTGVGKTTTILFLSGRRMGEDTIVIKSDLGDDTNTVIECLEPPPEGMKIGHKCKSETSEVRALPEEVEGMLLGDAPGQFDTEGPLTDVANAVGISNAAQGSGGVRVVLLVDLRTIETRRGAVYSAFCQLLNRFVDMREHMSCVSVFYTKGPRNNYSVDLIKRSLRAVHQEKKLTEPLVAEFISSHFKYVEANTINVIIDPLEPSTRDVVLSIIKATEPIPGGEGSFGLPISEEGRLLLRSKCEELRSESSIYLKQLNLGPLSKTLDSLELLSSETRFPGLEEIYQSAQSDARGNVTSWLTTARTNYLIPGNLKLVSTVLENLRKAYVLIPHVEKQLLDEKGVIIHEINSKVTAVCNECKQDPIGSLNQSLTWLREVQHHLPSLLVSKRPYDQASADVLIRVEELNRFVDELLSFIAHGQLESLSQQAHLMKEEEEGTSRETVVTSRLAEMLQQARELSAIEEHLPEKFHNLGTSKCNELDGIISGSAKRFTSLLQESDPKRAGTSLRTEFHILSTIAKSHALSQFLLTSSRDQAHGAAMLLQQTMRNVLQTIQSHATNRRFDGLDPLFCQLHMLLGVDAEMGREFRLGPLKELFKTLEEQLTSIRDEMLGDLQRAIDAPLEQQASILRFVAQKMNLLKSAQSVDTLLDHPLCLRAQEEAAQRIDKKIKLILEAHSQVPEEEWPSSAYRSIQALNALAPFKSFVETLSVVHRELADKQEKHIKTLQDRLPVYDTAQLKGLAEVICQLRQDVSNVGLLVESELVGDSAKERLAALQKGAEERVGAQLHWATDMQSKHQEVIIRLLENILPDQNSVAVKEQVKLLRHALDELTALGEFDALVPESSKAKVKFVIERIKAQRESTRSLTLAAISQGHLEVVPSNLGLLDAFAELSGYVEWHDLADLNSKYDTARLALDKEIQPLLERKQINQVVKILRTLGEAKTMVENSAFNKTRAMISDHFERLCNSVNSNAFVKVAEPSTVLQALRHASDLLIHFEAALPLKEFDIPIEEFTKTLKGHWERMLEDRKKKFQWALTRGQYPDALEILSELHQVPHAIDCCADLEASWTACLKAMPRQFEDAMRETKTSKIDAIFHGLQALESRYDLCTPEISDILEKLSQTWREKLLNDLKTVKVHIQNHNTSDAQDMMQKLHLLAMGKSMPPDIARKIETESASLEVVERQTRDVGIKRPAELRKVLDTLFTSDYKEFAAKAQAVEEEVSEMKKAFIIQLSNPTPAVWSNLNRILSVIDNVIAAFEEATHLERCKSNIKDLRNDCIEALHGRLGDMWRPIEQNRRRSWPQVNEWLSVLEAAEKGLGQNYFPEAIRKKLVDTRARISEVVKELSSTRLIFEGLELTKELPLEVLDTLNNTLTNIQKNMELVDPDDEKTLRYSDAIHLLLVKLDALSGAVNANLDLAPTTVMNLTHLAMKMAAHSMVKEAAINVKGVIVKNVKEVMLRCTEEAVLALEKRNMKALESAMIKLKKVESAIASVAELLPESQYQKLVNELQISITNQARELKRKIELTPDFHDISWLVDDILVLNSITIEISSIELHSHVHKEINIILNSLSGKKGFDFFLLGTSLIERGTHGKELVEGEKYPQFRAFLTGLMNELTSRMTVEDALKFLTKSNPSIGEKETEELKAQYQIFLEHFDGFLQRHLLGVHPLEELVGQVKSVVGRPKGNPFAKLAEVKGSIPQILAGIFAVWSVHTSSSYYKETKKMECVLKPHPVQVLSLLRLLEVDSSTWTQYLKEWVSGKRALTNHMVQIGTGEGKSVILGGMSVFLALLGFDVYCACYSKYLSRRDFESFSHLFSFFEVVERIHYSTLADLAGTLLTEEVDIRVATNLWMQGLWSNNKARRRSSGTKILLIDEVDVFFDREFYGSTYNPSTYIRDKDVNEIMVYIWKNRGNRAQLGQVRTLPAYLRLQGKYAKFSSVISNAISKMITDVSQFDNPPYVVTQDEAGASVIGYKEFGSVLTNITYGYKTVFAYLKELENKTISQETVEKFLGLKIECGQFSYAELPKHFSCILGVTGTLTTLGEFERGILQEDYQVTKQTVTPSIYGPSNLSFLEKDNVHVEMEEERYLQLICAEILDSLKKGRAVLVFFADEKALHRFATSGYGKKLTFNDFSQTHENLDFYVKKAVRAKELSLLPRVYGRGMDFVCRDQGVEDAGGVHVIQTFLSEELSEEVQIKGRTARQGKKGSYSLVLWAGDLEREFKITKEEIEEQKKGSGLYSYLNDQRNKHFNARANDRKGIIERSLEVHKRSIEYRDSFKSKNSSEIEAKRLQYLLEQNRAPRTGKAKIMCLSDATGSMGSVWNNAKAQIAEMLTRIAAIGGAGQAELKWVAYRDYSDKNLLEASEWEADPMELMKFLQKIECTGGGDGPEAVEVALELANNTEERTRVILIADAEPHMEGKGNTVAYHRRVLHTDYIVEANKLKEKGVPVYCFYMNKSRNLVKSFTEIADITGGKAALFHDANTLIDVIAENVLDDLGGDELVQVYRKTYHS